MHAQLTNLLVMTAIPFGTLVGAQVARQGPYTIQDRYSGSDFFSQWSFFTGPDPTHGNVNYLSMAEAQSQMLAHVNSNNAIVLAVDSTSSVPPGGNRNSVRITSNKSYNSGLFIIDAAAMPVGCGTWPSIWTTGPLPSWPSCGEIDIVEGVNNQASNQMTLHTGKSSPCTIGTSANGTFTGTVINNNCDSTTNDLGCGISNPNPTSFGAGFNGAGGGVFAMLWDTSSGIFMWHFPRANIPADITNASPTPANWGTPAGFWSAQTCGIPANFVDNSIIIDTTLCGDWAGSTYGNSGCPGTCAEMVANASNFVDAQWVINYIAVYQ